MVRPGITLPAAPDSQTKQHRPALGSLPRPALPRRPSRAFYMLHMLQPGLVPHSPLAAEFKQLERREYAVCGWGVPAGAACCCRSAVAGRGGLCVLRHPAFLYRRRYVNPSALDPFGRCADLENMSRADPTLSTLPASPPRT